MQIDLVLILLVIFSLLWITFHLIDRRRVINGFFFFISIACMLMTILYLGITYNLNILNVIAGIFFLLIILFVPIIFIYLTIKLFTSGYELMKKEGISLSHSLSFLLGFGILASVFLAPFIWNKINSRILKIVFNYFLSIFTYFVVGFIIYYFASIVYKFYFNRKNKDYIIVLGSGLNKDKVTPLLKGRIDKAIEFYNKQILKTEKIPIIVMSGGQGPDELVPEAVAMKEYAVSQGIKEIHILCEDKSKTTEENLLFSKEIIEKDSKEDIDNLNILFVTTNYHVFRAALLTKRLGLNFSGIGSSVKIYFYISAVIREYIAVLVMNKKFNTFMLIVLFINALITDYLGHI